MATKQQVIDLNINHPDWSAKKIAEMLGCKQEYVGACKRRYGLVFAREPRLSQRNKSTTIVSLGIAARAAGLTVELIQQIAQERRA